MDFAPFRTAAMWLLTPRCLLLFVSNSHFGDARQPGRMEQRRLSLAVLQTKAEEKVGGALCPAEC